MEIINRIGDEVNKFIDGVITIAGNVEFSQYDTVKRMSNLANKRYESGQVDKQGRIKLWFDIIGPRINDETKNIDLDTDSIKIYSDMGNDRFRVFLANTRLREWMNDTRQAERLNDDIEDSTGSGNVVWKKNNSNGMDKLSLTQLFIFNPRAKFLNETSVAERHLLSGEQMRKKSKTWDKDTTDEIIESQGGHRFNLDFNDSPESTKDYEVYEFNGEVTEYEYNEAKNLPTSEEQKDNYFLAKVVCSLSAKKLLFIGKIKSMDDVYAEYHRGAYKGRWLREGLYEALTDIQTRCNQIGNELARSMTVSGKQIFTSDEDGVYNSVMTQMRNGDIIPVRSLSRVDTRFQDIAAVMSEWNNLMALADRISNSSEIVTAAEMPSKMPARLGALMNANANKYYLFIQEKFGLSQKFMYENWVMPELLKTFNQTDVIRITGDKEYLDEYRSMIVDNWYSKNLLNIGPHTREEAKLIKEAKMEELSGNKEEFAKLEKGYWDGFLARIEIDPTGEGINVNTKVDTLNSMIGLETDPARRAYLLDQVWSKLGVDVVKLPKPDLTNQSAVGTPAKKTDVAPPIEQ